MTTPSTSDWFGAFSHHEFLQAIKSNKSVSICLIRLHFLLQNHNRIFWMLKNCLRQLLASDAHRAAKESDRLNQIRPIPNLHNYRPNASIRLNEPADDSLTLTN